MYLIATDVDQFNNSFFISSKRQTISLQVSNGGLAIDSAQAVTRAFIDIIPSNVIFWFYVLVQCGPPSATLSHHCTSISLYAVCWNQAQVIPANTRHSPNVGLMLDKRFAASPTSNQHWVNVWCLLGLPNVEWALASCVRSALRTWSLESLHCWGLSLLISGQSARGGGVSSQIPLTTKLTMSFTHPPVCGALFDQHGRQIFCENICAPLSQQMPLSGRAGLLYRFIRTPLTPPLTPPRICLLGAISHSSCV